MPRQDDFVEAQRIAAEELAGKDPAEICRNSLADFDSEAGSISLNFIGRAIQVKLADGKIINADDGQELPVQEQGLVLHYLNTADGAPLNDEMITYREVPSGEFYYGAFVKRAEAPMLSVFGKEPGRLAPAAEKLGGKSVDGFGDVAVRIEALPRVSITLVIWEGDDEFEPAGKILFDSSITHYLSTEDIAVVSGMVVYRLMKLAF